MSGSLDDRAFLRDMDEDERASYLDAERAFLDDVPHEQYTHLDDRDPDADRDDGSEDLDDQEDGR